MTHRARRIRAGIANILLGGLTPAVAAAQTGSVPLSPEAWTATDSIRSVSYLGRPALYINRGVALVRGGSMESGTLDLDVAASDTTNFLGVAFRAAAPRFSNVLFLRPGASGTEEAVQYGPAFNSVGVAWQVYHGEGANGVAMNPGGLRSNLGVMAKAGDAVYLPLRRGRDQNVFAVIECTGGWAFSARLDSK